MGWAGTYTGTQKCMAGWETPPSKKKLVEYNVQSGMFNLLGENFIAMKLDIIIFFYFVLLSILNFYK